MSKIVFMDFGAELGRSWMVLIYLATRAAQLGDVGAGDGWLVLTCFLDPWCVSRVFW